MCGENKQITEEILLEEDTLISFTVSTLRTNIFFQLLLILCRKNKEKET